MKNFKTRLIRAYNSVFGKLGGALLAGGILALCCNIFSIAIPLLCVSAVSFVFCAGKMHLEDKEVELAEKYFPEPECEEYKSENKECMQEISFEKQENAQKTNEQQLIK